VQANRYTFWQKSSFPLVWRSPWDRKCDLFTVITSGWPVTRPQSKSIQETLRKAGSENVFDFRNLFQEPQIFREF